MLRVHLPSLQNDSSSNHEKLSPTSKGVKSLTSKIERTENSLRRSIL